MFRVIYDQGTTNSGTLACPRCARSHDFDLSDAKNAIFVHFNPDESAHIVDPCPAVRWTPGETPWEAVDAEGELHARGRVIVRQIGNAIQSPDVIQDWPER